MATSYANNGGTGDRRAAIVVSTNFTSSAGDLGGGAAISNGAASAMIDGTTSSGGREFGSANNGNNRYVQFDFGPSASVVINEFKLYLQTTTAFGTFTWEGSNDGSSWTTIGASFTLGTSGTNTIARTNSTGYRYYRVHTTSFSGGAGGFWREFEFKLEDTTPQSSHTSYYNGGGFGDRSGLGITVSTTLSVASGTIATLIEGSYATGPTHALVLTNQAVTGLDIQFDFGAGVTVVIDALFWYRDSSGTSTWQAAGSNDGASWTNLGSAFSLATAWGASVTAAYFTNTTAYRYYRVRGTGGTVNGTAHEEEFEFRISGFDAVKAYVYKASGYGIVAPDAANVPKLAGYGVIQPIAAHALKLSGYAVIKPPAAASTGIVMITAAGC